MTPRSETSVCEAVGVFNEAQAVELAVHDLLTKGFGQADVSVLATEPTVRDKLGHYYQDVPEAEDDLGAPRQPWVQPEVVNEGKAAAAGVLGYLGAMSAVGAVFATGGAAATAILAGVVGGGATGAIGATLGRLIDRKAGTSLQTQLEHGGIVLWVRCDGDDRIQGALDILLEHGAEDAHVHHLRVGS